MRYFAGMLAKACGENLIRINPVLNLCLIDNFFFGSQLNAVLIFAVQSQSCLCLNRKNLQIDLLCNPS